MSAWAGIRPLVRSETNEAAKSGFDKEKFQAAPFTYAFKALTSFKYRLLKRLIKRGGGSTAQIARNHVIEKCERSGLVSLMGGKWTSYRAMGEETVDYILENNVEKFEDHERLLENKQTTNFSLIGSYDA
mmetsp:Transcript_8482/g.14260  ORF Transcript_8482/g.14260 Transcript_8482/m.14260 type:complete len:130 (-) Transcript_8482:411-800(-)